jgi:tetratricopeptide (TPR) repeat protein
VRQYSPQEIADSIENNLNFLVTEMRDVPEQHRSMRAVFERSWAFLSGEEKDVLKRLSVFRGGFTADAAQAVTGATTDILARLVDKYLISRDATGRYDMHELLRQFADSKLGVSPHEKNETQRRHGFFYAAFISEHKANFINVTHRQTMLLVASNIENIRSAWNWAVTNHEANIVIRMWEGVWTYYSASSRYYEGNELFMRLSQQWKTDTDSCQDHSIMAIAWMSQGFFSAHFAFDDFVIDRIQQSIALCVQHNFSERNILMYSLLTLGYVSGMMGRYETAEQYAKEGLGLAKTLSEPFYLVYAYVTLGMITYNAGQYEQAKEYFETMMTVNENMGSPWFIAYCLSDLSLIAEAQENYSEARYYLEQSVSMFRASTDDQYGLAEAMIRRSRILCLMGDYAEASDCLYEALQLAIEVQTSPVILDALVETGQLFGMTHKSQHAVEILSLAMHHPASMRTTRRRAESYLAQITSKLSPDAFATAQARGKSRDLKSVVQDVLSRLMTDRYAAPPRPTSSRTVGGDDIA